MISYKINKKKAKHSDLSQWYFMPRLQVVYWVANSYNLLMYFHFSKVECERFSFFVLSAIGFFSFLRSLDKQYLFLACCRFFNFFRLFGLPSWRNARHLWFQLHQQFTCQDGARWSIDKFNPWMWIKLSKYRGKVLWVWIFTIQL